MFVVAHIGQVVSLHAFAARFTYVAVSGVMSNRATERTVDTDVRGHARAVSPSLMLQRTR